MGFLILVRTDIKDKVKDGNMPEKIVNILISRQIRLSVHCSGKREDGKDKEGDVGHCQ